MKVQLLSPAPIEHPAAPSHGDEAASHFALEREFGWTLDSSEMVHTVPGRDQAAGLTVNLISETVDGCKGHGVHTAFLQTKTALERAGVDVRINSRDACDIVHVQTMGLKSLVWMLRAKGRTVLTAHIVPESLVGSFLLARVWLPIGAVYMHAFYALADEVLAVSPEVLGGLHRMRLKVPTRVVPNAIEVERFVPQPGWREDVRERLGISADAFVAICVGQVQPRKGIEDFLATARAMPDVTFLWVGGMPFQLLTDHYRAMRRAMRTAPSNCHFVGEVPYGEMPKWYAAADCLLFPSLQETFGFTIVEAAAAGLPVILRDIETYRPLFGDSCLSGGSDDFADLVALLRDDPGERARYGGLAREMAARFDTSHLAEQLLSAYHDVLACHDAERAGRLWRPILKWAFGARPGRR